MFHCVDFIKKDHKVFMFPHALRDFYLISLTPLHDDLQNNLY